MSQILEFASNHYILVSSFFLLWTLFFVLESRRGGEAVTPQAATNLVNADNATIIDLRDTDDFAKGHIAGSVNIPAGKILDRIDEFEKRKDSPIILVCDMGNHASQAGRQLRVKGIEKLYRIQGGLNAWRAASLPLVKA